MIEKGIFEERNNELELNAKRTPSDSGVETSRKKVFENPLDGEYEIYGKYKFTWNSARGVIEIELIQKGGVLND